jgi:hypothetical protein
VVKKNAGRGQNYTLSNPKSYGTGSAFAKNGKFSYKTPGFAVRHGKIIKAWKSIIVKYYTCRGWQTLASFSKRPAE